MTGDHHGRAARRATLLVRAMDEILGTHRVAGGAGVGSGVSTGLGRAMVVCCYYLFRVWLPAGRSASGVRQLGRGITRGAGRSGPWYR